MLQNSPENFSDDHSLAPSLLEDPTYDAGNIEKIGIDEMLQRFSGEFGWWQLKHFVLTSLAWSLEAFHTMVMIFADREPDWRCTPGHGSACARAMGSVCGLESGSWEWVGGSRVSTVSEFGLVCGEKYKVGLVQSAFFAGGLLGAGIFGHLSDSFLGRKGTLTLVCALNAVSGICTAMAPNYWIYFILRFLTGVSTGGVGLCSFVLANEPVGPTKRGAAGMSSFYFFSAGILILSGIAYIFREWRSLYLATSLPSILFVICVVPFILESPRWYLVRGRHSDAMHVMKKIAESNGAHLPAGISLVLDNQSSESDESSENSASLLDVVKTPLTRMRLILMVCINLACSIVYYGLSLNVVNLGTNLYLNVFVNGISEMPAFTITAVLLGKFGRRAMVIATMGLSGAFCILGSAMKGEGLIKGIRMLCGVMGIFGMAGTYNLLFIYTSELFPTVVRNAALGCVTQAGQVGAILAPMVVVLGGVGSGGPAFGVFGACGLAGAALAFCLPETLNQPLYDTMAGLEDAEGEERDMQRTKI
ncbi:organic cation/carnitine transporter 4 [Amborella trichopoda]|uniref:Major facilitator superfamily (MFS) profile domain-containing protein n=1 Tax=Amborella trichopoda TaxID=13333 RepID=W1PX20_AMBTC|nr:organic cation/carnitine transporter 4 [Amborella trichopoda]ERN12733.1 hypothetical protein AMTR_s00043p00126560 [Amborella trichopoda]|eukprot:XP_006851152.1 organic cation/carnitine transporter 4 [Amborella trichopoda]